MPDIKHIGDPGVQRGVAKVYNGPGEVLPGTIALADADGELWYLHLTNFGHVFIANQPPDPMNQGQLVGTQS